MSDRTKIQRKKAISPTITNQSLASPNSPTLASPRGGFVWRTINTQPQTVPDISSNLPEVQLAGEQFEAEVIQQQPLSHDINRISLRPQAKVSVSQPENSDSLIQRDDVPGQTWGDWKFPLLTPLPKSQFPSEQFSETQTIEKYPLGDDISRISLRPLARLTVGQPGDPYEQEADRVADMVMRMQAPEPQIDLGQISSHGTIQRKCAACEQEEEEKIQRKPSQQQAIADGSIQTSSNIESQLRATQGGGSPLPDNIRAFMEPRFGNDFSSVRVHTDNVAVQLSRELGAQAFTYGSDIYFGAGKSPGNNELMAHELTHVVQQMAGVQQKYEACQEETKILHKKDYPLSISSSPLDSVQRVAGVDDAAEAAGATAVLAWCVSGALVTVGLDELFQVGKWIFKGGKFKQNWCKTLFSALFGCVFGVAGGAFGKMFLEEGIAQTLPALVQWLIKKLLTAGYTQIAGKLGLILAKAGCDDLEKVSDATPTSDDEGNSDNQGVAVA